MGYNAAPVNAVIAATRPARVRLPAPLLVGSGWKIFCLPRSTISADLIVPVPPSCASDQASMHNYVHVKDPAQLHVMIIRWTAENTKIPSMHCRMGSATLVAASFPQGGSDPNFPEMG